MKIYIAGPMTGLEDKNYPAFQSAKERCIALGHDAISPHDAFGGDSTRPYTDYIREDTKMLLECEAIALLPGWEKSRGARYELLLAQMLGLVVLESLTFTVIPSWVLVVEMETPLRLHE